MKELKYLLTTKYIDQDKWKEDSEKGFKVLNDLRAKKLPKFQEIKHYENQFDFWEEELGVNYFFYFLEYSKELPLIQLYDFELFSPENEWKELNEWFLVKASQYILDRVKELKGNDYQIRQIKSNYISFDSLKMDFELRSTESENQQQVTQEELLLLDRQMEGCMWKEVYDKYLKYRVVPDYSKIPPQIQNTLSINNQFQYALYKEYLQKELDRHSKKADPSIATSGKAESLTNAQVALILHYTGVLDALQNHTPDNTVKARIISAITGIGYKGIYDPIGKVHTDSLKTKKNLIAVLKRLKECDLNQFANKVDWDLKTAK